MSGKVVFMKFENFESEFYNYCVKEGLLFDDAYAKGKVSFSCKCLFDDYSKERQIMVKNLVNECSTVSEFISTILNDCPDYVSNQAYSEISKIFPNHDARIISMIEKYNAENDSSHKINAYGYSCDCGSVKIGNKGLSVLYSNGYGDGAFTVFVAPTCYDMYRIESMFEYVGTFQLSQPGNLYSYDCGDSSVLTELQPGRYNVYSMNGTVLIVKFE